MARKSNSKSNQVAADDEVISGLIELRKLQDEALKKIISSIDHDETERKKHPEPKPAKLKRKKY